MSPANKYNNNWLSIEIDIADDYTCETDCWWTVKYDFGSTNGLPTDRTVWSPFVFEVADEPAPAGAPAPVVVEPATANAEGSNA